MCHAALSDGARRPERVKLVPPAHPSSDAQIATENDRLAIFKLAAQMHLETDFRYFDFDPGIALAGLTDWLGADPHSVMFVADDDGDVVGMLGATVRSTWFGRHKFASEELFYVTPAHRGSGVATGSSPAAERLYQRLFQSQGSSVCYLGRYLGYK